MHQEADHTLPQVTDNQSQIDSSPRQEVRRYSRRTVLGAILGAAAVGLAGCVPGHEKRELQDFASGPQNGGSNPPEGTPTDPVSTEAIDPATGTPEVPATASPFATETVMVDNTAIPSPFATEASTFAPDPTATTQVDSTSTPIPATETSVPATVIPENTSTPEKAITYPGRMEYRLNTELTSDDVPVESIKANPAFNKDGRTAEEVIQRALLKAHYRAYVVSHEGRQTFEDLNSLSPEEFEEKLLNGEDMSYEIYARTPESWNQGSPAKMKVNPEKGIDFAICTDPTLAEAEGNIITIQKDLSFSHMVDSDGKITCVLFGPFYAEQTVYDKYGLTDLSASLMRGAETMSFATQSAGGIFNIVEGKSDSELTIYSAEAQPGVEADGNEVINIPNYGSITPLFVR